MPNKELGEVIVEKVLIPLCAALPLNMVILRDENHHCRAVTDELQCPYARKKRLKKNSAETVMTCEKNTLLPLGEPQTST